MALFQFLWLRRLIRKNTRPIPINTAALWKQRLSIFYMLVAWNAFGFVCYQVFSGKSDWARYHGLKTEEEAKMPPAQQWAKTLGIDKAKVYRISGLSKKGEYELEKGEILHKERNDDAAV